MIQAKFGLNWPSGFRGEDFLKSLQTDDGRQVMAIAHTGELKSLLKLISLKDVYVVPNQRIFGLLSSCLLPTKVAILLKILYSVKR